MAHVANIIAHFKIIYCRSRIVLNRIVRNPNAQDTSQRVTLEIDVITKIEFYLVLRWTIIESTKYRHLC